MIGRVFRLRSGPSHMDKRPHLHFHQPPAMITVPDLQVGNILHLYMTSVINL